MKQMADQMREAEYSGLTEDEIRQREQQKEMLRQRNIRIMEDTLEIAKQGSYVKDGTKIILPYTAEQLHTAKVFLPEDIEMLRSGNTALKESYKEKQGIESSNSSAYGTSGATGATGTTKASGCVFGCEKRDTLVLARKIGLELEAGANAAEGVATEAGAGYAKNVLPKVLVLNMASATQPGGQVRNGASAQEEDLCRRTSLLISLESEGAAPYYEYNNARKGQTRMGTDAVVLSPYVEVIKDSSSETLEKPFTISVISCSAPMVRFGLEGMSQEQYENMLRRRIDGLLHVAADTGYRHLVLGAFGCGIFGNDAATVSRLFSQAIRDFQHDGKGCSDLFRSICFAVLCKPGKDYNYLEFSRYFSSEHWINE